MNTLPDLILNDTIAALSTAQGVGAIAVIRISGPQAIEISSSVFRPANPKLKLKDVLSHHSVFGYMYKEDKVLDEVLVTVLKGPRSFTGDDTVEIGCHGSVYIQSGILQLLIQNGARAARPGEFSMRAFRNSKMDLSQAEAVADLIAAQSAAAHKLAMHQMRGGFSTEINHLREQLINFASLIELELDFSEEDVEFADRQGLIKLVERTKTATDKLINSFSTGNVIKNGVPVVIVGEPNAGKSTLLNAFLNEERAIVSEIPGTTRDTIEDTTIIDGVLFRFIDTAGLRETKDTIESIGISRAYQKMTFAEIILYLFDVTKKTSLEVEKEINLLLEKNPGKKIIPVANKSDLAENKIDVPGSIAISAKNETGLEELRKRLIEESGVLTNSSELIVTNIRHYEALKKVSESLDAVYSGINSAVPTDLVAIDIRRALHFLGEITGQVTTEDLLGNIFSKFCIGK